MATWYDMGIPGPGGQADADFILNMLRQANAGPQFKYQNPNMPTMTPAEFAPPGLPPNIEARGPGYEIQKPPGAPPVPPMPRNPVPAPMLGDVNTLPAINSAPYGVPKAPETPARPGFDWGPENTLWGTLGAMGQGMMQPSLYGTKGALTQGLSAGAEHAQSAPLRQLQMRKLKAEVGTTEQKGETLKQAKAIAALLPANHPARAHLMFGNLEKAAEHLGMDPNKLAWTDESGAVRPNMVIAQLKAHIEAAGKWQWGVTGHDVGGKPVHGWVNPTMASPGSAAPVPSPGAPSAPSSLAALPGATSSAPPPRAIPTQEAVPSPPPGVDPYKWAEEQAKLRIQQQANEKGRKERAPIVLQDIDRALDAIKDQGLRTGLPGVLSRQIPGTGADKLERLLDGVRAQVGFDQLNQMRQQSPTGAALGSVTERELNFLQSVMGSLSISQGEEQLRFNLRRLKNAMNDVIHGPGKGPAREQLEGAAAPKGKSGVLPGNIMWRQK